MFPIIGLILFLVWQNTMPTKAREAGKWALVGFAVGVVFWVLYMGLVVDSITESSNYFDY